MRRRCPRSPTPFPTRVIPPPAGTSLWQGDIIALAADAIVNAANEELLGCFSPFHPCIDNAIHSAAGPRLRADCDSDHPTAGRRRTRGHGEDHARLQPAQPIRAPHGRAGLPAAHEDAPSPEAAKLLARCYGSCLDLAAQLPQIRSLAFCGISTRRLRLPAGAGLRHRPRNRRHIGSTATPSASTA